MMKKWHEILITFAIIVVLLLLSFGLLKLPKLYFGHSDEKLNGVVSIGAYDIDNEIKPMSMTQLLDVFEKEDVLMVEEEAPVLDKELMDKLITGTLREFLMMIFDESYGYNVYSLTQPNGGISYASAAYTVLDVENDEIYSARVGAVSLEYAIYGMYGPGGNIYADILFNPDTCDLIEVFLSVDASYEIDFLTWLDRTGILSDRLNEYYGMELSWDKLWNGEIESNYLKVAPWDYYVEEKRILQTISSHMYETGYRYVDVTEMLQE